MYSLRYRKINPSIVNFSYLVILALFIFLLITPVHATPAPFDDINANKPAIRVVTEYLAPYQIKNADGSLGGMSTEIMHALFKVVGEDPKIHVMPWARAFSMAKKNKNTLIYSMAHSDLRDPQFQWVGKIMEERLFVWSLKNKFNQPIIDIEQLKDYKIAATRYSNVAQYLIDNKFYNLHQVNKEDQTLLMLYKSRVDAIVATKLTLKNRAKRLGLNFDDVEPIIEIAELNDDLCVAFSLNTDLSIVARYRNAFRQIQQNGIVDDIKTKWGVID